MGNYDDYMAYFNGEWVPYSKVLFPPHDRGFAVADVVFDQGRTFGGVPFRLEDHVNRLYRSLKYVRVDPGFGEEEMLEVCREGVARNDHRRADVGDFAINPIITRGASVDGPPSVCVIIKPIHFEEFARFYVDGAHAIITKVRSYSSSMLDAKVKHHSRMNFVLAELEARDVDPEGTTASAGRRRQRHRGTRVQRVHRQRRSSQNAEGRQHSPGSVEAGGVRAGRGSRHPGT